MMKRLTLANSLSLYGDKFAFAARSTTRKRIESHRVRPCALGQIAEEE